MGSDNDSSTGVTLRPCPFCGGEARLVEGVSYHHHVRCPGCGADVLFVPLKEADQAARAWNRRAERTCRMDEAWFTDEVGKRVWGAKCSACGHEFTYVDPLEWDYCPSCGARVVG